MSTWRTKYRVHPAADVFPMMSDEELRVLGEDIKAYGLRESIKLIGDFLLDGRNRLEAAERVGYEIGRCGGEIDHLPAVDPVAFIISANLHRRHMLKSERADAIVALVKMSAEKPDHADPVSKGGRGKKNEAKAKALEINATLPEEQRVSAPTLKRAFAKAEGRKPKPRQSKAEKAEARARGVDALVELIVEHAIAETEDKAPAPKYTARPMPKPKSGKPVVGLDAARQFYLDKCAEPEVDLDAEQEIVIDALREIAGKRAMQAQNRASTLPQGGRSDRPVDDPAPQNGRRP